MTYEKVKQVYKILANAKRFSSYVGMAKEVEKAKQLMKEEYPNIAVETNTHY